MYLFIHDEEALFRDTAGIEHNLAVQAFYESSFYHGAIWIFYVLDLAWYLSPFMINS